MNPEDVGKILDEVTSRLAPASQQAWNLMVTEARIASVFALIAGTVLTIAAIALVVAAFRVEWGSDDNEFFAKSVLSVLSSILLIASMAFLYNGVIGMIIPEYHLLNKFLNILSGNN